MLDNLEQLLPDVTVVARLLRDAPRLRVLATSRAPLRLTGEHEARRAAHETQLQQLSARWDALVDAAAGEPARRPVLEALRDRVLERNYINNLLKGIERELSQ